MDGGGTPIERLPIGLGHVVNRLGHVVGPGDRKHGPFPVDGGIRPCEKRQFRNEVSQTDPGNPVDIPVMVVHGDHDGSRVFMTTAIRGAQRREWGPAR